MLIVGGDDSNHAAVFPKYEINLAVFSFDIQDSIVGPRPNTRNSSQTMEWLERGREYRFTLLTKPEYAHSPRNLIITIPKLITSYLDDNDISPETLKIYLDGSLEKGGREHIRNLFEGKRGIDRVVVDNFFKKRKGRRGGIIKRPNCPLVVYHADVLANQLLGISAESLFTHENLVGID